MTASCGPDVIICTVDHTHGPHRHVDGWVILTGGHRFIGGYGAQYDCACGAVVRRRGNETRPETLARHVADCRVGSD